MVEKLVFIFCRSCAEEVNFVINGCEYDEEERVLEGKWITFEIELVVEEGYEILEVYEVWNYMRKKKGFFVDYIKIF